jgi:hypothetical protein
MNEADHATVGAAVDGRGWLIAVPGVGLGVGRGGVDQAAGATFSERQIEPDGPGTAI